MGRPSRHPRRLAQTVGGYARCGARLGRRRHAGASRLERLSGRHSVPARRVRREREAPARWHPRGSRPPRRRKNEALAEPSVEVPQGPLRRGGRARLRTGSSSSRARSAWTSASATNSPTTTRSCASNSGPKRVCSERPRTGPISPTGPLRSVEAGAENVFSVFPGTSDACGLFFITSVECETYLTSEVWQSG